MESMTGKVAWITGAGSGIGQATAVALASAGAIVVLSGRRPEPLSQVARAIADAGGTAAVAPLDVVEREAVQALAPKIERDFGRVDILVNNAGLNISERHWQYGDLARWDEVIKVNITGAYNCIAAVLPIMRSQMDGLIINISSWAGRFYAPVAGVAYGAAKHAVLSLNASVNMEECQNGIRACAICPAEVATPMMDQRPEAVNAEERARMLRPEDLAETIVFVAQMPARACLNEIVISSTWSLSHSGARQPSRDPG